MQCQHCHLAQTGILEGFCCRKCARSPGTHGPFCEKRLLPCLSGCGFAVTRQGAAHCCLRCERGEPHGPRCKRVFVATASQDHHQEPFVGPRLLPRAATEAVGSSREPAGGGRGREAAREEEDDAPDPELEKTLLANERRIREQEELIGALMQRVQQLEALGSAPASSAGPAGPGASDSAWSRAAGTGQAEGGVT
eukprot:Transcript_30965.p3 GENE.Transcript_30965~~Transcript_30965.p3  ORF type:complete len:195 (-),score=34.37 Transcript_30965:10-594(-)